VIEVVGILAVVNLCEKFFVRVRQVECHDCECHLDILDSVSSHPVLFVSRKGLEKVEISYFTAWDLD